jgi:hypothetical protein
MYRILKPRLKAPDPGGDLERSFPLEAQAAPEAGSSAAAAVVLVAANLVPLALVLWGGASVGGLVALYWAENVVIGFYTVLRMVMAGRDTPGEKIHSVLFFSAHYGIFCLVHGVFITFVFSSPEQAMGLLPLAALFVSHGVSFVQNYVRNGRYLRVKARDSFWRPYPRMFLLHVLLLAGAFYVKRHGSPLPMLVGLVVGKTLIDLLLHWRANRSP